MAKVKYPFLRKAIPLSLQYAFGDWYSKSGLPGTHEAGEFFGGSEKTFPALWEEWRKTEFADRATLENLQWGKFKKLLDFAYRNVPHYRQKCEALRVKPEDVQSYSDLTKLPIIEKVEVKQNPQLFVANDSPDPGVHWEPTSGSTGSPTQILYSQRYLGVRHCIVMRYKTLAGAKLGDRWWFIQRYHFKTDEDAHRYEGVYNPWTNAYIVASTNMTPNVLKVYVDKARRFKPRYLEGYSSAVYAVATYLLENKIDFHIPIIITRTDQLFPKYHKIISEAFKTDGVFNFYGNVEGVSGGSDCSLHHGKHTNMECQMMETLDENGNQVFDQPGTVVGTNLENYAMPLIRYRLGDVVTLTKEPCGCGRMSYMIQSMEGRADDLLVLPDGRKMSTGSLWLAGQNITGIKEYQIVQETPGKLLLNYSKMPDYKEEDIHRLIHNLRNHVGQEVEFATQCHDKVPLINGKFKFIVSKLN